MPAPAPSPLPAPAAKTTAGDADSAEIEATIKKVAKETLLEYTADFSDTKRWMNVVADQYTVDATREATIAAWPASQAIGAQLEKQLMSGNVAPRAQAAYDEALKNMEANAAAAAVKPADLAAFSIAPDAVHMAAHSATHTLSGPIARQSLLNAQQVLGSIATGVVVDELDGKVQEIADDPVPLAHHIDSSFEILDSKAPKEFAKIATESANQLVAQMKAAEALAGPSPSPAAGPVAAPPAPPSLF
jgi:hypothetical protein